MATLSRVEILGKIKNTLPTHIGYSGIIAQKDLDQGDTSQRLGTLTALLAMTCKNQTEVDDMLHECGHTSLDASFDDLEATPGTYRRSPDPKQHGHDPRNESRDQLSVLKIGMAANGLTKRLLMVLVRHTLRLGFHQNYYDFKYQIPDPPALGELAVYHRGLLGPVSWPLNHIIDVGYLVDLALRKSDNWDVDNMLAINLLFANYKYPTLWSKIAMRIYLKTNFMSRLWNYHKDSDGNNGCEPLYWLFRLAFLDMYGYQPADTP